jgi:hypothetical protein
MQSASGAVAMFAAALAVVVTSGLPVNAGSTPLRRGHHSMTSIADRVIASALAELRQSKSDATARDDPLPSPRCVRADVVACGHTTCDFGYDGCDAGVELAGHGL